MHSVTDRRTDGQQAAGNSRSYCVAVRSAKNDSDEQLGLNIPHGRLADVRRRATSL